MTPSMILTVLFVTSPTAATDGLDWLTGAWCGRERGSETLEYWSDGRGGLRLGVHRDLRDGRATGFEFLRIESGDAGAVLVAQPRGAPPVRFAESRRGAAEIVFANPAHDFPRRIGYRRLPDGALEAWIDGGDGGDGQQQWRWRPCAPTTD